MTWRESERELPNWKDQTQEPDFWQDKERAIKLQKEIAQLKEEISEWEELEKELTGLSENQTEAFEKKLREKELQVFLSEKYDKGGSHFNDSIRGWRPGCRRLGNDALENVSKILREKGL